MRKFILFTSLLGSFSCAEIRSYHHDVSMLNLPEEDLGAENSFYITPAYFPVVKQGYNINLFSNFLYWTAREDGINYQVSKSSAQYQSDSFDPETYELKKNIISTKHHIDPGFKIGLGVDLRYDGWDFITYYTWFRGRSSFKSNGLDKTEDLLGGNSLLDQQISFQSYKKVGGWALYFHSLDCELGRAFMISSKLLLRPFGGLKGSWLKQKKESYCTEYYKDIDDSNLSEVTYSTYKLEKEHQYQYFWGLGIKQGIYSCWRFQEMFSLYMQTGISALWGKFSIHREANLSQESSDPLISTFSDIPILETRKSLFSISPVLELELGLRWDYLFCDNEYRVSLKGAWEEQIWYNQNQFVNVGGDNSYGSLIVQGLSIQFLFDF